MEKSLKLSKDYFRKAWNFLVYRYSRCQLTYESDKLMALDGLTSRMREFQGEAHVFGLRPADLEPQLTWTVSSSERGKNKSRRSSPKIAPSWSWASINGSGISPEYSDLSRIRSYRAVYHSQALWNPGQPMMGTIVPNQHQGFLGLRSMLLPANIETVPVFITGMTSIQAVPLNGSDSSVLYCYLDIVEDLNFIEATGKVWCAPLFSLASQETDPRLRGRLLVQDTSQRMATFRRVGTFDNNIQLPTRGYPLRLPRPADLPVKQRHPPDFDFSDIPFKDKISHELHRPETPSEERNIIDFDTSAYDKIAKNYLQDRFPGVDYPGANITWNDGIEEHNIILC